MRPGKSLLVVLMLLSSACGYRLAGRRGAGVAGETLAVPTFINHTDVYRIEQRVSEVLRRELARSTRYIVTPEREGDMLITGEVLDYGAYPTVFNPQGRATQYAISLGFKVVVTDTRSGRVLQQTDRLLVREIFQLAQDPGDFVPEDSAAWERVAEKLASSVVSSLVNRTP
jgi:hypothetical protein